MLYYESRKWIFVVRQIFVLLTFCTQSPWGNFAQAK